MKIKKKKGAEAFYEYYESLYPDRWESLKESLLKEEIKLSRPHNVDFEDPYNLDECFSFADKQTSEEIKFYNMDYASFLAASVLPLEGEKKVLDMCAAPGGKSLVLWQRMKGEGVLELNEYSRQRKFRLLSVLKEFSIPENEHLIVKNYDGLNYGLKREGEFDSILLDAPCSSERHVMKSPKHLEQWSLKRPIQLGKKQYGLLCSALLALKAGGHVLYSTCALTPLENDEVIDRLLNKKSDQVELVDFPQEIYNYGEKTRYGLHFLPDKGASGPLFMCLLRKKS